MSKLPYIPLFLDSYLGGTQNFTTEQHGAYFLLLLEMWKCEGSLPNQPRMLATVAKVSTRRFPAIWEAIRHKFVDAEPGRITNARLRKEYQKSQEITAKRREAGAKGGSTRALKEQEREQANAQALAQAELKQKPPTEPQKVKVEKKDSEAKASDAGASEPMSVKAQVFAIGRPMLERAGSDKKSVGAALGALIKAKGEIEALSIITAMRAAGTGEPETYIWKIVKGKAEPVEDTGAAPQLELVMVDGKPVMLPVGRRAA